MIGKQFSVNLTSRPELKAALLEIAQAEGLSNQREILEYLVDFYLQTEPSDTAPVHQVAPPSSSPSPSAGSKAFVAKVSDRAVSMLENLRSSMFSRFGHQDDSAILMHMMRLDQDVQTGEKVIVGTKGRIGQIIDEHSKTDIDNAVVKDKGEWMAKFMITHLLKKPSKNEEKPKKKSWVDDFF